MIPFQKIDSINILCDIMCVNEQIFTNFLESKRNNNADQLACFRKMLIPKKRSYEHRIVYKVCYGWLLNSYKALFKLLANSHKPLDCVKGFVKGGSVKKNADAHLGKKIILNLDIKRYFESIDIKMVKSVFLNLGFPLKIAQVLSEFSTINEHLVQGINISPVIANLYTKPLDKELSDYCKGKYTYTRYADDITISSNKLTPKYKEIMKITEKHGFKLNERKTKYMRRGSKQYVTGLTIFDKKYARVPKKFKRKIRLLLHYFEKFDIESVVKRYFSIPYYDHIDERSIRLFLNHLRGSIDYIHSIEPEIAKKFYIQFNKALRIR